MDSKRFAMELEVAPGVLKAPGWQLCLSYEQKVREAAMDLIRLQCLPLAEALDRVRNDQEHRMFHWVQLFMQPGHQSAISAPASSSSSSSSAKRSAAAASPSHSSEVKALTSKLDKLASTVKLLADRCSSGGKVSDRSRPREFPGRRVPKARLAKAKEKAVHQKAKAEHPVSMTWSDSTETSSSSNVTDKKYVSSSKKGTAPTRAVYELMCAQGAVATRRGSNADASSSTETTARCRTLLGSQKRATEPRERISTKVSTESDLCVPCRLPQSAQFPRGLQSPFWFSARPKQLSSHRRSAAISWPSDKSSFPNSCIFPSCRLSQEHSLSKISPYFWKKSLSVPSLVSS